VRHTDIPVVYSSHIRLSKAKYDYSDQRSSLVFVVMRVVYVPEFETVLLLIHPVVQFLFGIAQ